MEFNKKSAEEFEKTFNQKYKLPPTQFVNSPALPKTRIILHHTAGTTAEGAARWWAQTPERVGTPYIIDRDGTIYQLFDDKCWAYHLGASYWPAEAYCVPIEIVAAGQLIKEADGHYFYPLWPNKRSGRKIDPTEVDVLKTPYMGYSAYHKYSPEQIDSVIKLMAYLMYKYPSIKVQPDFDQSFNIYNPKKVRDNSPGIYTHSVFRSWKVDVYPMAELVKRIKSAFIKPQTPPNT